MLCNAFLSKMKNIVKNLYVIFDEIYPVDMSKIINTDDLKWIEHARDPKHGSE